MEQRNYRYYDLRLSDVTLTAGFCFPDTAGRFGAYCLGESEKSEGLLVPDCELDVWHGYGLEADGQFEYSCFTSIASDELSKHGKGIMHAVAFRFRDKAYLISAPSGVGKSTMIHTLQKLYPGEFSVICGDRPILSCREDGSFLVEPSPWNGKEEWFGADAAVLGGFIRLSRSEQSSIRRLEKRNAALPVYNAWIQTLLEEATIHRFAELSTALIEAVPVWNFVSGGVPESARFLYENMLSKEAEV